MSTNKASSFGDASKKLIDHRSNLNALSADCYLCAPLAISDWNDSGNTYRNQINLFFYDFKPVHVTEVAEKIKIELDKTLKSMGLSNQKDIYGSCALTTSYDYILEINIWEYCKYLNPHIITGWDKQLSYVQRLREEDFEKLKYNNAKKQYQSSIVENIATPMFVFTGKIIQNYPLGLGVLIQVDNNAVVFKTQNRDSDIFNNLSTGQLNGVVISLLLSIKEIFTTSKSLNTLLIDDPLQTIDDISAISLIDLLSEHFGDTQIVLSTHEDDKQYLLKKKYEQSGKRCQVLNMQEEYLRQ